MLGYPLRSGSLGRSSFPWAVELFAACVRIRAGGGYAHVEPVAIFDCAARVSSLAFWASFLACSLVGGPPFIGAAIHASYVSKFTINPKRYTITIQTLFYSYLG